jgi:hypothetical protein
MATKSRTARKAGKSAKQKQERKARIKRVFRFFDRVVIGAVKVWLKNKEGIPQPYIVAADEVDDFLKSEIEKIK